MAGSFLGRLKSLLGRGAPATPPAPAPFRPPVPAWRPGFEQPLDRVVDRISYYANGARDFCVFRHGTCVLLPPGLDDAAAREHALGVLHAILHQHPDMSPNPMDDGNIMVGYNHPAVNVVLKDVAEAHWDEIEARHMDGLATHEVLFTPLGRNVFDDFGKQALLGRAWMFMDAQAPQVVRISRSPRAPA
ncbi:hypothetical protein EOD42_17570 [Rhodovarius crocodyli]|uniref:Uncharacterized protein n=1 Tax=Rhodovarius crocodyli TaxID=1979269 RepID=A0A437MCL6_9PROT|nr:hypothetical protein [Rhodovarius crocodyli]RVT95391.1 hypothetical protein EOD42_17570 [Rhodovarius crocodyli]